MMRAAAAVAGALLAAGVVGDAAEQRTSLRPEHVVVVDGDAPYFSPPSLVLRVGDTVRWQSPPMAEVHSVHDLKDGSFAATLSPGTAFTYRFQRPGEFDYGCRYHPWMRGHVTVRPYRVSGTPVGLDGPNRTGLALIQHDGRVAALLGPKPALVYLPAGPTVPLDALGEAAIAAVTVAPGGRVWLVHPGEGRLAWLDPGAPAIRWAEKTPPLASPVETSALAALEERVFRLTADGRLWSAGLDGVPEREWPLPPGAVVTAIAADGDRLWCADAGRGKLLRIEGDRLVERSLPPALAAPSRIATAPDGSVFLIAGPGADRLARLTQDGDLQELELAAEGGLPEALALESLRRGWLIRGGRLERLDLPDLAGR